MSNVITKRFVVRQSLIGKNVTFEFTNKKGDKIIYNHDKVFSIMKDTLTNLPCWLKYKSYTATNNIPLIVRGKELVLSNLLHTVVAQVGVDDSLHSKQS